MAQVMMRSSALDILYCWTATLLTITISSFCAPIAVAVAQPLDSWQVVVQNAGISAMHMATMHTDKVVLYDRTNFGKSQIALPNGTCRNNPKELVLKHDCTAHSVEYDSLTNAIRPLFLYSDTLCSSGAFLADGTLQQTGGDNEGSKVLRTIGAGPTDNWVESNTTSLFVKRWYSTDQILPDGRIIVVGGINQPNYEFVPKASGAKGPIPLALLSLAKGSSNLYPFVHLVPDGNLFIFANIYSILFNYKTNQVVRTFPNLGKDPRNYPYSGTSVMLPLQGANNFTKVEILICGGAPAGAATQVTKQIYMTSLTNCGRMEITAKTPTWTMEQMPGPRVMGDSILMPSREVLIINGCQAGVAGWGTDRTPSLAPWIYNPTNHTFQVQSATTIPRVYHSSVNMQSDGTLLVGGSNDQHGYVFTGVRFPTELRLEKYSPWYLNSIYDPQRLIITSPISTAVKLNSNFVVTFTTPSTSPPTSVEMSLYSPTFTSHSNSMSQRLLALVTSTNITAAVGGGSGNSTWQVQVAAPPNANIAPPGWYMLTALNTGTNPAIPSKATWVQITP